MPKTQISPIKIILTSLVLGEGYSLKVGSFSFCSPVSASDVSDQIFEIKATEEKTKVFTPVLSGSSKNVLFVVSLAASASTKISGDGFGEKLVIFPFHIRARQKK